MAYVIAVCGAGGKSSYIEQRARAYQAEGMRVAVTTTTHIFDESALLGSSADDALLLALQGEENKTQGVEEADGQAEKNAEKTAEEKVKKNTEEKKDGRAERDAAFEKLTAYQRAGAVYVGLRCAGKEAGKLKYPGDQVFEVLCASFDVVLVEADGARHMPIKIPKSGREPVIPNDTAEIVVVMGRHALRRPFGVVCQRAQIALEDGFLQRFQMEKSNAPVKSGGETEKNSSADGGENRQESGRAGLGQLERSESELSELEVTEELIRALASHYYLEPLRKAFPDVKQSLHLSSFVRTYRTAVHSGTVQTRRPALILMASGFGRRFGANKLMAEYRGQPLILHGAEQLLYAAQLLWDELGVEAPVILVTRYDEIRSLPQIRALHESGRLLLCGNPDYAEGISGSVRNGARFAAAHACTDFVYFAGDMPELGAEDIARYILEYLASGKQFAVMEADGVPSNPGILSAAYLEEILAIHGDRGGMQVIRRHPEAVYHYPIAAARLKDVDARTDLLEIGGCNGKGSERDTPSGK